VLADQVIALRIEIAKTGMTVRGSRGQRRANPLLNELREHQRTMASLLRCVRRPAREQQESPSAASDAGRSLVNVRWEKGGRRGA